MSNPTTARKILNLKLEVKLDLLGISEIRWSENGYFWTGNYRIIQTGTIENMPEQGGVGVILNKAMGLRLKGYVQYSGRVFLLK